MTKTQIVEDIKGHFPKLGETEIMLAFNRVYADFCAYTKIYTASSNLTLTTAVTYSLGSTVGQVYRIDFYDSSSQVLDIGDRLHYIIEHGSVTFYNTDWAVLTTWPTGIATVTLNYYKIPTAITGATTTIAIDTKYTEYIIAGALGKFYAKFPVKQIINGNVVEARDWQAVRYWNSIYSKGTTLAIQEANKQQDATAYDVALQDFNVNEE